MGVLFIPYPGVENDEALFANGIFAGNATVWHVPLFGHNVTLMVMSYVGALKAWLYALIFKLWSPSPYSLRLPVLLAGALTLWLFVRFLDRIAGRRAALIGCVLLATSAPFLLTVTFDWGPVALQHLLLFAGMVLLLRFHDTKRELYLAAGFFAFGLGLWDKAIFAWTLSGAGVAVLALFHREIRGLFTWRRVGIVCAAGLLGALPLVAYNLGHSFATFSGRQYSFAGFPVKVAVLRGTLAGNVMAGFLVDYAPKHRERPPEGVIEKASVELSEVTGHRFTGWLPGGLLLAVLLAPLAWRTRYAKAVLFLVLAFGVSWGQMLVIVDGGGSAHHTVLLLPYLIAFIAVSFAAALDRLKRGRLVLAVVVTGAIAASNLLVVNEHLAGLIRYGAAPMWTDAIYPLTEAVRRIRPANVFVADWGMGDGLRMFLKGRPPVDNAINPFGREQLDDREREQILERAAVANGLFISHAGGREVFPVSQHLAEACAEQGGFRREPVGVIHDSRGREVFELYRYGNSDSAGVNPVPGKPTESQPGR